MNELDDHLLLKLVMILINLLRDRSKYEFKLEILISINHVRHIPSS